jgi:three-Cys-motif partner protein
MIETAVGLLNRPGSYPKFGEAECGGMAEEFFTERADQSEVKARIVTNYFDAWARIIAPRSGWNDGRVAYIDLFAGPGRYEDGSASTPLMVLTKAIGNAKLRAGLVSIFNDQDENHTRTLEKEIHSLPGIEMLKHKPQVYTGEINRSAADYFESTKLIATFSFIDPFGYKGLSWTLVRGVIKDWGSDCVFFFNFSRINAGVFNPVVFKHMEALFGRDNFEHLREAVTKLHVNREQAIIDHLTKAMKDVGAKYVLAFRFRDSAGRRTTHHLIFVTKHPTGYEIMKEIMAVESSYFDQGVPSFEYSPALANMSKLFENALDELEDRLVKEFEGQTLSMIDLYHQDNLNKPYTKKNYKVALHNLEHANRITADPAKREKGTFADGVLVTFPRPARPRT